jgi:hypothetical protein
VLLHILIPSVYSLDSVGQHFWSVLCRARSAFSWVVSLKLRKVFITAGPKVATKLSACIFGGSCSNFWFDAQKSYWFIHSSQDLCTLSPKIIGCGGFTCWITRWFWFQFSPSFSLSPLIVSSYNRCSMRMIKFRIKSDLQIFTLQLQILTPCRDGSQVRNDV